MTVLSRKDSLDLVKAGMRSISQGLQNADLHWKECYERGFPEEHALRRALLSIKEAARQSLECLDDLLDDNLKVEVTHYLENEE